MNEEQIKSLIDQLKGAGLEEEQIMDVFYETFKKGKMDRKDLETLANALGYELTDDFKEDSTPDPIEGGADLGDISEEKLEEAKEIGEGESKEDFEEKIEDIKDDAGDELKEEASEEKSEEPEEAPADDEDKSDEEAAPADESDKSEEAEEESDEDKEWEEANKLFKL